MMPIMPGAGPPIKALIEKISKMGHIKKTEKIEEIDNQLEELFMGSNINAYAGAEQNVGPLTAIALAAGRLFRPGKKESRVIEEQLNSVLAESENMVEGHKPLRSKPIAVVMPGIKSGEELTDVVNDVKTYARKYKEVMNVIELKDSPAKDIGEALADTGTKDPIKPGPDVLKVPEQAQAEAPSRTNDQPPAIDFSDDLMSKLAETAKVEDDVALDIMGNMKDTPICCDELESGLQEISALFKSSTNNKQRIKTR
jgi:hypothetical protein